MRGHVRHLLILLGLVGCTASPAPVFFGAARHDLVLEGIGFTVFVKNNHAEVVRLGYLPRKARDPVPALMVRAAEEASGCRVTGAARGLWRSPSLPGDTGEARFALAC
ncbi:hypothetical protein SAMN05877809_101592 [Rhodobacter sp. JA431]|nr:hypothetical protein SAMN05877809_101592 [Rhodobacter sp. JA431]